MPILGEIKRGKELGYKHHVNHIWQACKNCGKERWVIYQKSYHKGKLCHQCAVHTEEFRVKQRAKAGYKLSEEVRRRMSQARMGAKHPRWKGGRIETGKGYINILIRPDDPYFRMAGNGKYVLEHRLIMARHLGRCLETKEIVHHLNGIRGDNRLKNLALVKVGHHSHRSFTECLQKRIRELEGELAIRRLI